MRLLITLACMLSALFSTHVNAAGIPITPGLWEVVTTVSMPMMPQPKVTTTSKCMVEEELSPDDFNQDMGGQEMEVKMNWQGKRIGNCP